MANKVMRPEQWGAFFPFIRRFNNFNESISLIIITPLPTLSLIGFPGFLTPEQDASLASLRQQVQELGIFPKENPLPDQHLLRFLRARQFDVNKSISMMQADLAWRREFENHLFKASECPSLVEFAKNGLLYLAGNDKDGRPVLVMNMAKFYPREVKDLNEVVMFWVSYVHRLTQACEKAGHTDYTIIADLIGFSPSQNFSLALIKVLINILQNFYPERMGFWYELKKPLWKSRRR